MSSGFLLSWERGVQKSTPILDGLELVYASCNAATMCLWASGVLANRTELVKHYSLPRDLSNERLIAFLYTQYGLGASEKLVGTLAWILWDGQQQELVCSRDRMGTHGVFYAIHQDSVFVANRVKRLLSLFPNSTVLNVRSIIGQIHGEYPVEGETSYEKIRSIEAGTALIVRRDKVIHEKYWAIKSQDSIKLHSDGEYADAFRNLAFTVIQQYVPDCPFGITLSSGMDSNTLAATVKQVAPNAHLTAFSWFAPELPTADESKYCLESATYLGVPIVTFRADQYWTLSVPGGIQTSVETPRYSFYAELYDALYSEVGKSRISVLFLGLGGDELFGGVNYSAYADLLLTGRWFEMMHQIRRHFPNTTIDFFQFVRHNILFPIIGTYLPQLTNRDPQVPWLAPSYDALYQENFAPRRQTRWTLPGKRNRLDMLQNGSPWNVAEEVNRIAGDYGIELRHPWLDHRLVEFALGLPSHQTYRGGTDKWIMRYAMMGYLPDEVVSIPKIYPTAICARGLKEREQAKVWKLMTKMRAAEMGFVDEKRLQQAYTDYLAGKGNEIFWHTLTLEDWLRRYFS